MLFKQANGKTELKNNTLLYPRKHMDKIRAELGSISHGTMRLEDLIPTFTNKLDELVELNGDYFGEEENYDELLALDKLILEARTVDMESEEAGHVLDSLFNALNDFAPPNAHFGAHEGDGADYGFWNVD